MLNIMLTAIGLLANVTNDGIQYVKYRRFTDQRHKRIIQSDGDVNSRRFSNQISIYYIIYWWKIFQQS